MSVVLRDYQIESRDAVERDWSRGVQRPALIAGVGAGKGFLLDEPIPTPTGVTAMGELSVGDLVVGSDGRPTAVTGVYDRGILPTYRVSFSDGSSVVCDGDHLWPVRTESQKSKGKGFTPVETRALASRTGRPVYIPMTAPVERPPAHLPIDPYVLGVFLGDGKADGSGTLTFSCQDDTAAIVATLLPAGTHLKRVADCCGGASTWRVATGGKHGPMARAIRALGLWGATSWTKFIPRLYLNGSIEQRLSLLQGMCDTDGHVPPGKGSVDWVSVSERMANDMSELVTSLGGKFRFRQKSTTWTHEGVRKFSTAYRGHVVLPPDLAPVRVARKLNAFKPNSKYLPTRRIVSVEPAEPAPIRCITVAAPDRLFLATRQHLVTHNTTVFTNLAERFYAREHRRVLIVAHRTELIDAAAERVRLAAPHYPVGIVKAERNQTRSPIIVASIQTLAAREYRRARMIRDVGLVVCDEAHRARADSWMGMLDHFGAMTPGSGVVALGVTATMSRGDDKSLGDVWQSIAHEIPMQRLIGDGWLVRPVGIRVFVSDLDLRKVRQSGGDYAEGALGLAIEQSLAPKKIAEAIREHAATKQGIVFTPTIHSAEVVTEALRDEGFNAVVVSGKTPTEQRKRIIRDYRAGVIRIMVNADVFTEGTDLPMTDYVCIARPTRSNGRFIQMAGRALRLYCPVNPEHAKNPIVPAPTCSSCKTVGMIIDVVGVTSRDVGRLQAQIDLFGEDKQARACRGCGERPCSCWCERCNEPIKGCTCPCLLCEEHPCVCNEGDDTPAVPIEEIYDEGILQHAIVDLFTGSASVWLRTERGVWFLPAGERLIAILPAVRVNTYDVVSMHADKPGTGQLIAEGVDSLALAQRYAEDNVTTAERRTARKDRAWRAAPPTKAQRAAAAAYKVEITPNMTAGELDGIITVAKASWRIDPIALSIPHIAAAMT